MVEFKTIKMTRVEKSVLELLIAEIQGCKSLEEVNAIVNPWITANDLHPERVETMTNEEFQKYLEEE